MARGAMHEPTSKGSKTHGTPGGAKRKNASKGASFAKIKKAKVK